MRLWFIPQDESCSLHFIIVSWNNSERCPSWWRPVWRRFCCVRLSCTGLVPNELNSRTRRNSASPPLRLLTDYLMSLLMLSLWSEKCRLCVCVRECVCAFIDVCWRNAAPFFSFFFLSLLLFYLMFRILIFPLESFSSRG